MADKRAIGCGEQQPSKAYNPGRLPGPGWRRCIYHGKLCTAQQRYRTLSWSGRRSQHYKCACWEQSSAELHADSL